jgi:hypothetical protein
LQGSSASAPTWKYRAVTTRRPSYTIYSVGCAIVWAVILGVLAAGRDKDRLRRPAGVRRLVDGLGLCHDRPIRLPATTVPSHVGE